MKELIQKEFVINILGQDVVLKQLSLKECIENHYKFQEKDFDVISYVYNILKEQIEITKEDLLKLDFEKIFQVIIDYQMKDFYTKGKPGNGETMPYEAFIAFLLKELGIGVNELLSYTPELINFLTEGVIYNINAQTKEGQRRNKLNQIKKQNSLSDDEILKQVQEMRQKKL